MRNNRQSYKGMHLSLNGDILACTKEALEQAQKEGIIGKNARVGKREELITITASQKSIRYGHSAVVNNSVELMQGASSSQAYLNGDKAKSTPGLRSQSKKMREIFRRCILSPGA